MQHVLVMLVEVVVSEIGITIATTTTTYYYYYYYYYYSPSGSCEVEWVTPSISPISVVADGVTPSQ